MSSIDNRIVRMKFDNESFERKVSTTLNTLEKLKEKLKFNDAHDSFRGITVAASKVDFTPCETGVESLKTKLSSLGVIGTTALVNLTNSAVNAGKKIVSSVIGPLTTGGWTRAMNIEEAKFKLDGLGITGQDLADVWKNVDDAVSGTAYSLDAAALVASQLAASGMRGGEEMGRTLKAISGLAAVTGSSYGDIGRIFTQVAGQGKVMADQLNMIAARGTNASVALAKSLNVTEAEVKDLVSKGKVDFQTFADAMYDSFHEAAFKANESLTGVMSNVRSALSKIGADFVTPFVTNVSTEGHVSNLVELMNRVRESINMVKTAIEPFRKAVTGPLLSVVQGITSYIERFNKLTADTAKSIKPITETITKTVPTANKALESLAKTVIRGDWGNGADRIKALTEAGHDYAETQNIVNQMMWGTYDASKAANKTITEQIQKTEEVEERVRTFRDAISEGFANLVNVLVKPLEAIFTAFGEVFKIEDSVLMVNMLADAFYRLTAKMVPSEKVLNALKTAFKSAFTTVKAVMTSMIIPFQLAVKLGEVLIGTFQRVLGTVLSLVAGFSKLLAFPFEEFNRIVAMLFSNNDFLTAIRDIATAIQSIKSSFNTLKKALLDAAISITKSLGGPFERINEWLKNLRANFESGTVNLITSAAQKIAKFITALAKTINDWVSKTTPSIDKWAKNTSATLKKWVDGPVAKIAGALGSAKNAILDWSKNTVSAIASWFSKTYDKISRWVGSSSSSFRSWVSGPASKVGGVFGSITSSVSSWFSSTMPTISSWTSTTFGKFKTWASDVFKHIKEWSDKVTPLIKDWCKDTIENVSKWFKETYPKFKEWCEEVWKHLEEWYNKAAPIATDWVEKTTQQLANWAANIGPTIRYWSGTMITNFEAGLDKVWNLLTGFFTDIKNLGSGDVDLLGGIGASFKNSISKFANMKVNFKFNPTELFKSMFKNTSGQTDAEIKKLTTNTQKSLVTANDTISKTIKKSFLSSIYNFITEKTTEVLNNLTSGFTNLTDSISNSVNNMPLDKIKEAFGLLLTTAFGLQSIKSLKQMGDMFESFGGIGKSISGFVDSWKRVAVPKPNKMAAFLQFSKSIAILAGSLSLSIALLTQLDYDRAWGAVGQLLVLIAGLGAVMIAIDKLVKDTEKIKGVSSSLLSMALGVAALAIPVAIFGSMDLNMLTQGLFATGIALAGLTGAMYVIGKSVKTIKGAASTMLAMALSLTLLIVPIKVFAGMDTNTLITGMGWTALALIGLSAAMALIGEYCKGSDLKGAAATILALSASLILLIVPIKVFGTMDFNTLSNGLITVGIALLALAGFMKVVDGMKLDGVAKTILALVGALTMLIIPITILGALPFDVLFQGGMAVVIMLIALSGAMIALSSFSGEATASAGSILLIAGALTLLTVPIIIFGTLPWQTILGGILGLAGALVVLLVAGAIAELFTAGLLALAGAALGLGGAMVLGAAAIWLIADAISKVADLAPGAGQKLVNFLAEFSVTLAQKGFEIGMNLMAGLIKGIIGGAIGVFKGLFDLGAKAVDTVKEFFGIHSPSTLFQELGQYIPEGFTLGIDGGQGDVLEAINQMGLSSTEELTNSLSGSYDIGSMFSSDFSSGVFDSYPEMLESMRQYGLDAVSAEGQGVTEASDNLRQDLNNSQKNANQGILDAINADSKSIKSAHGEVGSASANAYANGYTQDSAQIQNATNTISNKAVTGLNAHTEEFRSAGTKAMNAFKEGINGAASSVSSAGNTVVTNTLNAINNRQNEMYTAGSRLLSKMTTGIQSRAAEFQSAITRILDVALRNINARQTQFYSAGANLMTKLISGVKSREANLRSSFTTMLNSIISTINGKAQSFYNAGSNCATKLIDGLKSKNSSIGTIMNTCLNTCVDNIRGKHQSFYNAGAWLVQGFADGITDNTWRAEARSTAMAAAAITAAKKRLAEKSPSRVGREIGAFFGIGFANGIGTTEGISAEAGADMANAAVVSLQSSLNRMQEIIDNEIPDQPVIRPVMDLSDVESKIGQLSRMTASNSALGINASLESARSAKFSSTTASKIQNAQPTSFSFVQNNYSPKELSRLDIYRDTKNQFAQFKKMVNA